MCGIIARVGPDDAIADLLSGLENLEYRGYDSAGVAVQNGTGIAVRKRSGEVDALERSVSDDPPCGTVGIGHTRWSTHGRPTDENAHPHTSQSGDVAVVHNGVIENHDRLRRQLERDGHVFESETDTEVVPHLFESFLEEYDETVDAFRRTVRALEGSYAIAALVDGEDAVYATRKGSPLVVGLDDEEYYVASDVPAFLERTDRVVYLEDDDVAVVRRDGIEITDATGSPVARDVETVDWDAEETGRGSYDHYMLKEINDQPRALDNAIRGRVSPEFDGVDIDALSPGSLADVSSVRLVGCGTSYHAALYGERLLTRMGVRARAIRASEYDESADVVDDDALVVAVTQSGETADTLGALRRAQADGVRTLAVTNVAGSTATREADHVVPIRAGPEIGVAATKTFSSQAVTLSLLAQCFARDRNGGDLPADAGSFLRGLYSLPDDVRDVLERSRAEAVARLYADSEAVFFIGRGLGFPVALEGALKFKEITYKHAEGFAAGELKHGPLALVTPRTPLVALFAGDERDERTLTNAREAQTRGANVIAVAPDGHAATEVADAHLRIPATHPHLSLLPATVQLQLLSYHSADLLSRPIDKPRNLAKSVTVN